MELRSGQKPVLVVSMIVVNIHLGTLVVDCETAEQPGRHPGLGGDVVPAHGLRGGEPLVSVALHGGVG